MVSEEAYDTTPIDSTDPLAAVWWWRFYLGIVITAQRFCVRIFTGHHSGGVLKDGIPAITDPVFESVAAADVYLE